MKVTIIQVYAPADNNTDENKEVFYGLMQDTLDNNPWHDIKLFMSHQCKA